MEASFVCSKSHVICFLVAIKENFSRSHACSEHLCFDNKGTVQFETCTILAEQLFLKTTM